MYAKLHNKGIKLNQSNVFEVLNRLYDLGFRWENDKHIVPDFIEKALTSQHCVTTVFMFKTEKGLILTQFHPQCHDGDFIQADELFAVDEIGVYHIEKNGGCYDYTHFLMGDKFLTIIQKQGTEHRNWYMTPIIELGDSKYKVAHSVVKIQLEQEIMKNLHLEK